MVNIVKFKSSSFNKPYGLKFVCDFLKLFPVIKPPPAVTQYSLR